MPFIINIFSSLDKKKLEECFCFAWQATNPLSYIHRYDPTWRLALSQYIGGYINVSRLGSLTFSLLVFHQECAFSVTSGCVWTQAIDKRDAPTLSPLLGSDLVTYYHQMTGFKLDIWKSFGGISGRLLFPQITQWLIPLQAEGPLTKSCYKDMEETWPMEGKYYMVNHVQTW